MPPHFLCCGHPQISAGADFKVTSSNPPIRRSETPLPSQHPLSQTSTWAWVEEISAHLSHPPPFPPSSTIPGLGRSGPPCPLHCYLSPPHLGSGKLLSDPPSLEDLLAIPVLPHCLDFHTILSIMKSRKLTESPKDDHPPNLLPNGSVWWLVLRWKLQENMIGRGVLERNPIKWLRW